MNDKLPGAAGDLAKKHPDVWSAYSAIGAGSEGAVHSHARRALDENIPVADLHQTAFLAIGPLGFPRAVASWTWITDVTEPS
jgi:hypothetical protein